MALKNVWAYTYIPLTILRHGVWGGYGYIESTAYPSTPLSTKKEYTKESPLEKLFHNVCAYYIHIPTPPIKRGMPRTLVEISN